MVVTRFPPSPTGYLHIGGARTALFNWLFARKMGGKFILRIEDTDPKRNSPTATQQVINDLKWLGIDWDEGPEIGGPNGPYLQSERRHIYDRYINKLLDENKAYYCFDTVEQLQALRLKAQAEKQNFLYPRPEVFPSRGDAEKAGLAGKPVTVRFAMPADEPIVVCDLVRGDVTFGAGEIGDFIIQKADGMPTYNFACVVDDELMGITHVTRGQEHLMNTPGQQALQKALGFRTPVYAHMSVTISEGGGKLSKRERPKALRQAIKAAQDIDPASLAQAGGITTDQLEAFVQGKAVPDMPAVEAMARFLNVPLPEINVVDFFRSGYLPEAMVNFIALLGWNPGDKREIMPLDELIETFALERLTKSNSLFARKKLTAFNTEYIRLLDRPKLREHFKNYLKAVDSCIKADDELLDRILEANAGARTLAQIEEKSRFIFLSKDEIQYDQKAINKVLLKDNGQGLEVLRTIRRRLADMDELTFERIEDMLRSLAEENESGLGKVAQPLRVAICGSTVSPPIFDSVDILGREETLARIDKILAMFQQQ